MTVCNACRYCEQYCPVFPAVERRVAFTPADLSYLANLCHNCGECLYACQYAPPHEFGIDVPRTLAAIRGESYEAYCWPRFLAGAFRRHDVGTGIGLAVVLSAVMFAFTQALNPDGLRRSNAGDFYGVVPHAVMVALFGLVSLFVLTALGIGATRFWRVAGKGLRGSVTAAAMGRAVRDALTLRHLHSTGVDCTSDEDVRTPWRRWFHHCTFYGFLLCFASTCVAAIYHGVFGWHAPYALTSVPVLLGTVGGVGLVIGPAGLFALMRRRDPDLGTPGQREFNGSFLVLLFLTSVTGLALMILRDFAVMGSLLVIHLGVVLALFITLPYGKFVHGVYRFVALVIHATETEKEAQEA
jgi:citrate/tricarballylate utilization protein